MRASTC